MAHIVDKNVSCNTCTNDNCEHGKYYILRDSKGNYLESLGKDNNITVESVASKISDQPVSRKQIFKIDEVRTTDVINELNELDVNPNYSKDSTWGKHEKPLNNLVNNQRINDPNDTLYISTLVREHDIDKELNVIKQFNKHQHSKCKLCGQTNNFGDFTELVDLMYEKQSDEFGYQRYSRETCNKYLFDLFTSKTIDGIGYEGKAIDKLSDKTKHKFRKPTSKEDGEFAVDIIVEHGKIDKEFAGIQVKPISYDKYDNKDMRIINQRKNNKFDYNVYYLYYDKDEDQFINLDEIQRQLNV